MQPTLEVTEEEWERVFKVNVKGIFHGSQAFMQRIIEQGQGGSMINISSTGASRPRPGLVWYNASKGAVSNVRIRHPIACDTTRLTITGHQRSRSRIRPTQYSRQHRMSSAQRNGSFLHVHWSGGYPRKSGEVPGECAVGTIDRGG